MTNPQSDNYFPLPWREGIKGRGENKDRMTSRLTNFAKTLRKRSTDAELLLWQRLRARRLEVIKFRRQQPVEDFVVDFLSFEKRIIIELDGGQHAENRQKDRQRDRFLTQAGFKILRFWNNEVLENMDGVLERIRKTCLR
jgi:very-short-patch-repair endonuclease